MSCVGQSEPEPGIVHHALQPTTSSSLSGSREESAVTERIRSRVNLLEHLCSYWHFVRRARKPSRPLCSRTRTRSECPHFHAQIWDRGLGDYSKISAGDAKSDSHAGSFISGFSPPSFWTGALPPVCPPAFVDFLTWNRPPHRRMACYTRSWIQFQSFLFIVYVPALFRSESIGPGREVIWPGRVQNASLTDGNSFRARAAAIYTRVPGAASIPIRWSCLPRQMAIMRCHNDGADKWADVNRISRQMRSNESPTQCYMAVRLHRQPYAMPILRGW